MDYSLMKMTDVAKLEGIKDIKPLMAKGKFAQALIAEAKGERVIAEQLLNEAVVLAE